MSRSGPQTLPATDLAPSRERGMIFLLSAMIALLTAQRVFGLPLSMGPGLSAENALLYLIAGALAFRAALSRKFRFEMRALHVCFAILIVYSAVSILAAVLVFQYPGYQPLHVIIGFKARLVDQFVFFAVFFYGVQSRRSALFVVRILFLFLWAANLIALLDAGGVVAAPGLQERLDGRIGGIMGESNQSAAFLACILPGFAGLALMTHGLRRLLWLAGLVISAAAMIISVSRGAFVAVFVAAIWGMVVFRRYIPVRAAATAFAGGTLVLIVGISVFGPSYGELLMSRIVGDSTNIDMVSNSSGRLEIWTGALARMLETPFTFVTGFGWDVYASMPFRLATHNHYLSLWFNVGLIGLICGVLLLILCIREAATAARVATDERPILIAFAVGAVALAVAVFFVDLYAPWLWFWAYAGLAMRIAVNVRRHKPGHVVDVVSVSMPAQPPRDAFGWVRTARQ